MAGFAIVGLIVVEMGDTGRRVMLDHSVPVRTAGPALHDGETAVHGTGVQLYRLCQT